ncbi:MAG: alpha/beta hydrolase [Candidatus Melainabacteria bacterium]
MPLYEIHHFTGADGVQQRYSVLMDDGQAVKPNALWYIAGLGGSVKGAIPFLKNLLPTYSPIYGCDLRSFGLNKTEAPLRSTAPILADLNTFYRTILQPVLQSSGQTLDVCGISLGAAMALHLMHDESLGLAAQTRALSLLAPAFTACSSTFPLTYQIRHGIGRLLKGRRHWLKLPYGIRALTSNADIYNDPQYQSASTDRLTMDFLLNVKTFTARAQNLMPEIQMPTLVVVPGRDVVCSPEAMRRGFAMLPPSGKHAKLEYPELFHDVTFEKDQPQIAGDWLAWIQTLST